VSTLDDRIKEFFEDMSSDVVEERVAEYCIREVHGGRKLMDVIQDPYVKNRLNEEKVNAVLLENPEVIEAMEMEIAETFRPPEVGFSG
jgi:hypothetical protein